MKLRPSTLAVAMLLAFVPLFDAQAVGPVQLRNFREIYSSLESITGLNGTDSDLRDVYRSTRDRLPRQGNAEEFGSPVVLALTELSGTFCAKAVAREKMQPYGERTLFGDIDFERGPNQFNEFALSRVSSHFSVLFWNRELKDLERQAISSMVADFIKEDSQSAVETEKLALVLCTTFGTGIAYLVK